MTVAAPINCCPKCGGTNGYEGVLHMAYDMNGVWGEGWVTSGSDRAIYASKTVRCVDCGKRVDRTTAAGGDE